ncbi:MAG: dihydroorotate dehydrogenase-like protein [Fimbriimonadaceae bacterium]|nr:dihydroorotate dehydrogenase-like protein [Fimbriimonadaceae bacterium]
MDLSTKYLGLDLPHPFMPGASKMSEDLDTVRRFEDAGAAAIVLQSLFEEQIVGEQLATYGAVDGRSDAHAEALTYFPTPEAFRLGPEEYLEHVAKIKASCDLPVIGSLNGSSLGGWLDYAKLIEQAGAAALELNAYYLATSINESGEGIEARTVEMVRAVRQAVTIPLAVKLSPFYTSMAHVAQQLCAAGAAGLVLFNRFYQPDIDVEELAVVRSLRLSDSSELLLRLRWLAILSGRLETSLAVSGGVHSHLDAVKSIMCGAHAVQMVSALFLKGPSWLAAVKSDVAQWMESNEYVDLTQMQGSMNLQRCPDTNAYERANYMHVLRSFSM